MAQKKLSPVLAVTTIILLLSSCDLEFLDSHSSASDMYEICVHVYDDATDEFIDSAFVSISADKKVEELSFRETISGYTQKGEWCASFAHGYQLSMFTIGKKGYADQCIADPTVFGNEFNVELKSLAYLQLHVRNLPPSHAGDWFVLEVPGTDCYYNNQSLDFYGAGTDTVVTVECRPGPGLLRWKLCNPLSSTQYQDLNIKLKSNDTLKMELLY